MPNLNLPEEYVQNVRERQCAKLPNLYTPNEVIDQANKKRLLELQKKATTPISVLEVEHEAVKIKTSSSWKDKLIDESNKGS